MCLTCITYFYLSSFSFQSNRSRPSTPFCFGSAVGDTTMLASNSLGSSRSSSERLSLLTAGFQLHGSPSGIQICLQLQPLARVAGGPASAGSMAGAGPALFSFYLFSVSHVTWSNTLGMRLIYILSDFSSIVHQPARSFFSSTKKETSTEKQPMASSKKNISVAMLLIVIVAAGMYVHMYELLEI